MTAARANAAHLFLPESAMQTLSLAYAPFLTDQTMTTGTALKTSGETPARTAEVNVI